MVNRISQRGIHDWLAQRVTAVLIVLYSAFLIPRLFCPYLNKQAAWQGLFSHTWMKVATLLVVASVLWHAWIGLWTVFTDYIKSAGLRYFIQTLVVLALASLGFWALLIVLR